VNVTVFWQHVGLANSARDFPRTIGTSIGGLCEFSIDDVRHHLNELGPLQQSELVRNFNRIGTTKFQIWGLPTGAKDTLKNMITGDYLLLLDTNGEEGAFRYFGRVLYHLPSEHWDLSMHLWKERTFPIIVFLRGTLGSYPWFKFLSDLAYGSGLKPMGRTYRIAKKAIERSRFGEEAAFYDTIMAEFPSH
jgi:hypothetical protein